MKIPRLASGLFAIIIFLGIPKAYSQIGEPRLAFVDKYGLPDRESDSEDYDSSSGMSIYPYFEDDTSGSAICHRMTVYFSQRNNSVSKRKAADIVLSNNLKGGEWVVIKWNEKGELGASAEWVSQDRRFRAFLNSGYKDRCGKLSCRQEPEFTQAG